MTQRSILSFNFVNNASNLPLINILFLFLQKIEFVSKLLNCQYQTLSKKLLNNLKARAFVFKKPDLGQTQLKTLPLLEKRHFLTSIRQKCQKNSLRLTKLFRLRMSDILAELENPQSSSLGPDFKVILLQRDPRGTINSLKREIHEWLPGAASPEKICGNLYEDYSAVIQVSAFVSVSIQSFSNFQTLSTMWKTFLKIILDERSGNTKPDIDPKIRRHGARTLSDNFQTVSIHQCFKRRFEIRLCSHSKSLSTSRRFTKF